MLKKILSFFLVLVFFVSFFSVQIHTSEITNAIQPIEDRWVPLNKGLNGGVITVVIADPNSNAHFFAGTAEHGVFETDDGGDNWVSISKTLENKMVLSLALGKNNYLYVGTYQDLFRTKDHGTTWEKSENKFKRVNAIIANSDIILVGTNDGLYRSIDKTNNLQFFQVGDTNIIVNQITSLTPNPGNQSIIYAGTPDKGVLISLNGGTKWNYINSGLPQQPVVKILIDQKIGSKVYALLRDEGIWQYTFDEPSVVDNSNPWKLLNELKNLQGQSAILSDNSNNEIFIGTKNDGLFFLKVDSNQLTKLQIPGNFLHITSLAIKNSFLITGTAGKGCLRSRDQGKSWEIINNGLDAIKIINLLIDPDNHKKWIASSYGCVFISNDNGAMWKQIFAGLPESLITCIAFHPQNSQILYAGSEESGLFESTDGGANWSKNKNLNYSRITCILVDRANPGLIYVGTLARGIFVTLDFGKTWSSLDLGTKKDQKGNPQDHITILYLDATNANIVYAGTSVNGMFKSIDQGKSWLHIYEALGKDVYINDIQVNKKDNNIIYAGIKIINDGGFIKSIDQGKTWETTNLFRSGMVFKAIAIEENDYTIVFCGTSEGVFYTKDTGYHWYSYDDGLDKAYKLYLNQFPINQILNDPDTENNLVITTNWGVYQCQKSKKVLDKVQPKIVLEKPGSNRMFTNIDQVTIKGRAIDEFGIDTIKVDNNPIEFNKESGAFSFEKKLRLGDNEFLIQALDVSHNESEEKIKVMLDQSAPELTISSPLNFSKLLTNQVMIKGNAVDRQSGIEKLLINQIEIQVEFDETDGYFEYRYQNLKLGKNNIEVTVIDKAGNLTKKDLELSVDVEDTNPPKIEILNPTKELTYTANNKYTLEGIITDSESGLSSVKINNSIISLEKDGKFSNTIDLYQGENKYKIIATDLRGNEASKDFRIVLDITKPKITSNNLNETVTTNTSVKNFIVRFGVIDESGIQSIQFYVNGKTNTDLSLPKENQFEIPVMLEKGQTTIKISATDLAGNSSEFISRINYDPPVLIKLQIGNNKVEITRDEMKSEKTIDVAPMIYQKRTMVPLRFLSEAFDATVIWLPKPIEEAKISYLNKFTIYLKPWNPIARIEYPPEIGKPTEKITLDAPPIISNNRTLVPIRFISDMFGAKVNWDGKKQTIEILLAKY